MGNAISFYERINDVKSQETIPFDIFLNNIQTGHWQDVVLPLRAIQDERERNEAKKKAPSVTISGMFSERTDTNITQHSGFIGIDIDDCDVEEVKSLVCPDKYIVAAFQSIGGRGLCLIFKINPEKHREAFQGICEYLYTNYKLIADPTSINPSRARFVSFDPHIYIADSYLKFAQYPKEKPPKKIDKVLYSGKDFDVILNQIVANRLNITQDSYAIWLRLGFAISHKFGEGGRNAFHVISQFSSKYDGKIADKQYTNCLKHKSQRESTIATFYYYAKQAGCDIYSDRTLKIAYTSSQGKKAGLSQDSVVENLAKFEDITGDDVKEMVHDVYTKGVDINEGSVIEQLELWLRQNYSLRKNEISRYIDNGGKVMEEREINDIWVAVKKVIPQVTSEMQERLINSNFVPLYNPFKEFFSENLATAQSLIPGEAQEELILKLKKGPHLPPQTVVQLIRKHLPRITELFDCIDGKDPDYNLYFGAKWLVGIISAIYGKHSPLTLVLIGAQNTGKTEFFRRLLPEALKPYYAESKLDKGKDDEMVMAQRIIVMDDEMSGKSKRDTLKINNLTSVQVFTLREPYGKNNVDLVRIAVLCGTTNHEGILHDPTGNRRIIPIQVHSIDHDRFNNIDKLELFLEIYMLYQCGLRWEFKQEDIKYLGTETAEYEVISLEGELIQSYFAPGIPNMDTPMTATQIKVFIENKTNQKLVLDKIGKELKRLGHKRLIIKDQESGISKGIYWVKELTGVSEIQKWEPPVRPDDDLPF